MNEATGRRWLVLACSLALLASGGVACTPTAHVTGASSGLTPAGAGQPPATLAADATGSAATTTTLVRHVSDLHPVVTLNPSGDPAVTTAMSESLPIYPDKSVFRYTGAHVIPGGQSSYDEFYVKGDSPTGGQSSSFSVNFEITGDQFEFLMKGCGCKYRLWLNCAPVTNAPQAGPPAQHVSYLFHVALGGFQELLPVRIEFDNALFGGIQVEHRVGLVSPPADPPNPWRSSSVIPTWRASAPCRSSVSPGILLAPSVSGATSSARPDAIVSSDHHHVRPPTCHTIPARQIASRTSRPGTRTGPTRDSSGGSPAKIAGKRASVLHRRRAGMPPQIAPVAFAKSTS